LRALHQDIERFGPWMMLARENQRLKGRQEIMNKAEGMG